MRYAIAAALLLCAGLTHADQGDAIRIFLSYTVSIDAPGEGAKQLDVWLPIAQDTDGQKVESVDIAGVEDYTIAKEATYENQMLHKRFNAPFPEDGIEIVVSYSFLRDEIVIEEAKAVAASKDGDDLSTLGPYLAPNKLIPIDGRIDAIANQLDLASKEPMQAARAIYDYLIEEFEYDWQADGAGKGDVRWACDSKTGDCTDYTSMFLALCRNRGIPADHEFGYPIRTNRQKGTIPFYHCWARFHVDGVGWAPLDASEADKHPELFDYNFGSQSPKLLKFTHGRDVNLVPKQAGPALNYFIHPYLEVDGNKYEGFDYKVRYEIAD